MKKNQSFQHIFRGLTRFPHATQRIWTTYENEPKIGQKPNVTDKTIQLLEGNLGVNL